MPLKLNAFSGGSVTLNPASTPSDFTLTLPAATGTVVHADTNGSVGIGTSSPLGRLAAASATGQVGFNTGTSSSPDRGNIWYDTDGSGWRLSIGKRQSGSYVAQVQVVDNGNFQFDSGYGSVATAYGCRAWVNFNGTGTVAIRGSGNVTSITDNGVGDYTVNMTTAMPDTNYAVSATGSNAGGDAIVGFVHNLGSAAATNAIRVRYVNTGWGTTDGSFQSVAVFR